MTSTPPKPGDVLVCGPYTRRAARRQGMAAVECAGCHQRLVATARLVKSGVIAMCAGCAAEVAGPDRPIFLLPGRPVDALTRRAVEQTTTSDLVDGDAAYKQRLDEARTRITDGHGGRRARHRDGH